MTVLREENGCFWGRAVVPEALGGPGTGPGTGTRGQAKMSEQGLTPALPRGRGDDPGSRRARRRRASQHPPPHHARGARNGDAAGAAPESHTGPRRRRERGRRTPRSTLRLPPAPAASPGRRPSPRPAVCPRPQERAAQARCEQASASSPCSRARLRFSTDPLAGGGRVLPPGCLRPLPCPAPPVPRTHLSAAPWPWPCLPELAHLRNQRPAQPSLEARPSCATVSACGRSRCPGQGRPCRRPAEQRGPRVPPPRLHAALTGVQGAGKHPAWQPDADGGRCHRYR